MKNWGNAVITPAATIRETIGTIDSSGMQIALVTDGGMRLLGTITDGDIRRGILRGVTLDDEAQKIMNFRPVVARADDSRSAILAIMKSRSIRHVPIVDNDGVLLGVEVLDEMLKSVVRSNPVVLMAGGLGSRLRPLTNDCPKSLLKVGSKPILETIIENFLEHGFQKIFISVNYLAEKIEGYFGDGSRWGAEISYLREPERLGTAGSLSLLPKGISESLLVMNGDLLTRVNFGHLLDFHTEYRAKATMCVRDYEYRIPFGVVTADEHRLVGIEEKPLQRFFVSAGIYVLEPDVLGMIPPMGFLDMPCLFRKLVQRKMEAVLFPVREYWMDIGRVDDFERANGEFGEIFS